MAFKPAELLMRFNCRRLTESEMPWNIRDCVFIYVTYKGELAYVGRADGGQTVASYWNLHEMQSHAVTRQIIRKFGSVMGMSVYAITPARQFPDVSVSEANLQVERRLLSLYDPPGNLTTGDRGKPRSDLSVRIDGWPLGTDGFIELHG